MTDAVMLQRAPPRQPMVNSHQELCMSLVDSRMAPDQVRHSFQPRTSSHNHAGIPGGLCRQFPQVWRSQDCWPADIHTNKTHNTHTDKCVRKCTSLIWQH